ncbi:DUF3291 domain-containing protein [Shinella sumterensis]|uniref:DUF3291 domain-containing protein n=1 Tax=Shinella sumterensis TaxID=1967501 RepID=UPI003F874532
MRGHHLAVYNFGIHVDEYESDRVAGFRLREPFNFEATSRAEGYIGRSGYDEVPGPESWGEKVYPRFLAGSGFEDAPSSLSLWSSLESLVAFTYDGVHADALKHARNWNQRQAWPALVLWWVKEGTRPVWADGAERLEHLADHGPTPRAFTFKKPFCPDGEPIVIDRDRVKTIGARNAVGQRDLLAAVRLLEP